MIASYRGDYPGKDAHIQQWRSGCGGFVFGPGGRSDNRSLSGAGSAGLGCSFYVGCYMGDDAAALPAVPGCSHASNGPGRGRDGDYAATTCGSIMGAMNLPEVELISTRLKASVASPNPISRDFIAMNTITIQMCTNPPETFQKPP